MICRKLAANKCTNRLPEKKSKSLLELAWLAYNDKVLILLTIAAVVSLALGLYQTLGTPHEPGEAKVEWVEGVAIIVAILIVVVVYVHLESSLMTSPLANLCHPLAALSTTSRWNGNSTSSTRNTMIARSR